jgi:hypothetical protein
MVERRCERCIIESARRGYGKAEVRVRGKSLRGEVRGRAER